MSTSMREALEKIAAICDRMAGRDNRARSAHMFDVADIARAALSSPAPDRLSERLREVNGDTPVLTLCGLLVETAAELDRLSRQPEAEPVAWRYKFNGKWHLCDNESFAKQGLEAHPLYTSPRLDRERLARTLYRRLVLNPPADFDDASADLQNEWLQLADAIMRETR